MGVQPPGIEQATAATQLGDRETGHFAHSEGTPQADVTSSTESAHPVRERVQAGACRARAAPLAMRAAIIPAPIPLSILTTARPGEQVCSMVVSAPRPSP